MEYFRDLRNLSVLLLMEISRRPHDSPHGGELSRGEELLSKIKDLNGYHGLGFLNGVLPTFNSLLSTWRLYMLGGQDGGKSLVDAQCIWRLLVEEAMDYEHRFSELLSLIGMELSPEERLKEECKFLFLSFANGLISQFKTSINVLFADFFGTDRPEISEGRDLLYHLFPRRLMHFLKSKVLCSRSRQRLERRHCELVYTIFQGVKKGLLPIRPHQVDESLQKHCKALTQSPVVSESVTDRVGAILEREFPDLPGYVARSEGRRDKCLMSTKAVIGGPRGEMGQIGIAIERLGDEGEKEISFLSHPVILGHFREGPLEGLVIVPNLRFADSVLRRTLRINNWLHQPRVIPQVILEPLKGRIITKPDPGQYIDMNSTQKRLWKYLQKFRMFALTGRPVSEEDIWYVGQSWTVGKKFVSGDFSAATDNLKGYLSELVLDYALGRMKDQSLVYQMKRSFLNSDILYKECFKSKASKRWNPRKERWEERETFGSLYGREEGYTYEKVLPVAQTNGQLMGHVLSFPILCLVNFLVFRLVYADLGREAPNVLVNGDDILFCATPSEYKLWKDRTTECGLIPSLGKNLFSDRIAQINSVLFKVSTTLYPDGDYHVNDVREVQYLSFGLLVQRGKGKDDTYTMERTTPGDLDLSNPYKMVAAAWEVWGRMTAPSVIRKDVLWQIFKRHWKDEVTEMSRVGLDPRDRTRENQLRFELLSVNDSSPFLRDVSSISSYACGLASEAEPMSVYAWRRKLGRVAKSTPDPNAEKEQIPRRRNFRS